VFMQAYSETKIAASLLVKAKATKHRGDLSVQEGVDMVNTEVTSPEAKAGAHNNRLDALLAVLASNRPWGDRELAAKELGYSRNPEALPALEAALVTDSFWMVRCAIVQAIERIGDPRAIPTLQHVADEDNFHVVREYAAKAIERLAAHS
jgi:HEAT repeat protein